jgi:hypothetical protein
MSELSITTSKIDQEIPISIFHLNGHLHGDTERQLMEQVRQTYKDGSRYLLLDLSGVEVLTSAGLRAIHNSFLLFTPKHDVGVINEHPDEPYKSPYFKLVCPNPNIYYVLNIAGFLQNIPIYNDVEDAVRSFS